MSTDTPLTPPTITTATSPLDWLPVIIDQNSRDEFDALVRELASVPTPLAAISDAVMIKDANTGNIAGVAYIQVRHVVTPIMIVEGAPADTLNRLMSVFTNQLRATLQETIRATNSNNGSDPHTPTDRHLSYDVYVSDGQQPPDGFERLDVEVWRRRVA